MALEMKKNMGNNPLVTVYIPTYNRLNLLRRAVDSVLDQDYPNIELIVVDDGSTDGTVSYLQELADKNPKVQYFVNEKNSGACVSRNKAIAAASGEFITGLDDDDYFLENRISVFSTAWEQKKNNTIALYSNTVFIDNSGISSTKRRLQWVDRRSLFEKNYVGNQVYVKTKDLRNIGGFDENLPLWQDYDCWLRLLSDDKNRMSLVPKATYCVDESHAHERIGNSSPEKHFKAFRIMKEKLAPNRLQLASLEVNICRKARVAPPVISLLQKCLLGRSFANITNTVKVLVISRLQRWPGLVDVDPFYHKS